MKYILFCISLLITSSLYAQDTREGDIFIQQTTQSSKSKETKTKFTYRTKDGKNYPVYISTKGNLYIYRVSKKGNTYKWYLPQDTQEQIRKELGILKDE